MYDWANSDIWTTVIAAVFPPYFVSVAASGMEPASAIARYAIVTAVALGIVAIISPILGAIADYATLKKRLFGVFLVIAVSATGALWFVREGDWRRAPPGGTWTPDHESVIRPAA